MPMPMPDSRPAPSLTPRHPPSGHKTASHPEKGFRRSGANSRLLSAFCGFSPCASYGPKPWLLFTRLARAVLFWSAGRRCCDLQNRLTLGAMWYSEQILALADAYAERQRARCSSLNLNPQPPSIQLTCESSELLQFGANPKCRLFCTPINSRRKKCPPARSSDRRRCGPFARAARGLRCNRPLCRGSGAGNVAFSAECLLIF